ncbi:MAG: SDR family oxidoreductase [Bacteroidota bacterium]
MGKLDNKTAIITGGNSGIGFASAKRFLEEGAQVIITGRREDALKEAVAELGDGARYEVADVSKVAEISALAQRLNDQGITLDVVFANAGIAFFAPLAESTEEFFDNHFNTNVKGVFFTIQKLLPVINDNASIMINASIVAHKGFEGASVYSATKAAVINLAKTASRELVSRGIRVNVISPGPIETPIYSKIGMPEEDMDNFAKAMASQVPMQRFGTSDEVAGAALFLASSDSSYIIGDEIRVDGGFSTI